MMRTVAIVTPVEFEAVVIADPRLIEELQAQRGRALFGFALTLGLSADQAGEAVQETLLRLWRELSAGRDVRDPAAWAFRTIYRISMDQHRLQRRLEGIRERLLSAGLRRPADGGFPADERLALWAAVDRLPPRQRHALYLRYRADLPFEEVASVLGMTSGGARTLVSRSLERLRRDLAQTGER